MRQWIALSLLCMSVLLLPVSASAACASPIKFGALTWESGQFTTGILKYIAESGYDCTIEEVPGAGRTRDRIVAKRYSNHRRTMDWALTDYGAGHQ